MHQALIHGSPCGQVSLSMRMCLTLPWHMCSTSVTCNKHSSRGRHVFCTAVVWLQGGETEV